MAGFSLIETMRVEPGNGIVRGGLHRARFCNSARKLGFPDCGPSWRAILETAVGIDELSRLRLEFSADGRHAITAAPFSLQDTDTSWTVRLAKTVALDSSGPLQRHKTTMRQAYETARAEYSRQEADEVIVLNDSGRPAEGTITNIFIDGPDGMLLTPPLSSGCLAGVLRTSLICANKARVAQLDVSDLETGVLYVGNSLRGLIRARLVK